MGCLLSRLEVLDRHNGRPAPDAPARDPIGEVRELHPVHHKEHEFLEDGMLAQFFAWDSSSVGWASSGGAKWLIRARTPARSTRCSMARRVGSFLGNGTATPSIAATWAAS